MDSTKKTKTELLQELQQLQSRLADLESDTDIIANRCQLLSIENEKLKAYFEHANDAILLFDSNGLVDCNDKSLKMFRCSKAQLLESPPEIFWPPIQPDGKRSKEFVQDKMEEMLKNKDSYDHFMEWRNLRYDGTYFDSELSVSSVEINGKKYLQGILRDVTERKKIQKELEISEKKLKGIIESIQDMYYRCDISGMLVMVNPAGLKMMGYDSEAEILGENISGFWCKQEELVTFFAALKENDKINDQEISLKRKDGSSLEASISSHIIYDEKGMRAGTEGIIRNVSDRKKAEHAREESQNFMRTIFENSGTATVVSEEDTTISLVSHEFEILTGYTKEEVEGKRKWTEFIHPDDLEKTRQYHHLRRIDPQLAPRRYVLRWRDKKDNYKIFSNTVAIIPGTKKSIASFLDITEHRKSEEAVRESELKYRLLFESAGDAFLLMKKGIVIDCNKKTLELFRCSKGEIVDRRFGKEEVFWPEFQPDGMPSRGKVLELLTAALNNQCNSVYWKYKRNDGTLFDSEVSLNFITLKNEKYMQCIIHDVSDRVRAEELYRTMANTSSAIVYIVQDGRYKFVNPNAAKYSGYSINEMLSMDNTAIIHKDDLEEVLRNSDQMLRRERTTPYEFRIICKDGSIRHLIETVTFIDYEGTRVILGNAMDITELKKIRFELDELRILENSILNTITHAVFGFRNRQIIFVNSAVEKVFGWKTEELLGKDARILYRSEEDFAETGQLVYALLEKQGSCSLEVPCRHKNGHDFYCNLNASAIGKDVHSGFVVSVYEDITDRKTAEVEKKRLEAQLIQSQKMEAVGTLAGGIAHDFNNLLMGIQGFTSILMMDTQGDERYHERLKSIEDLVQNGADLTRQLLGFARSGKYELKTTNINELIEKTTVLFARTKKEITISRIFGENIPCVDVDRSQIDQVLLNLLVNSWQAMPKGGKIILKTENVFLRDDFAGNYGIKEGRYVKISIADTGTGIDVAIKDRIFEPFFTTKEMGRGTGLGLAMVYGIVRGHSGIITVESTVNKGTQFDIYLPASNKTLADRKKNDEEIISGSETILVVDDEDFVADVSKEIMELMGYKVLVARSGHDAIKIYLENKDKIDLIIQDMVMPGMSGDEIYYALKIINPEVKVILSSGYMINRQIESVMEQGCRAFIQKPFRMEELSKKIREVLDNP